MATGVKPLNGGIQNWLLQRLERLINEFPGFPTLIFGLLDVWEAARICVDRLRASLTTTLMMPSAPEHRNFGSSEHHPQGAILLQQRILSAGVELACYRHPPTELPDSSYSQHLILIHTEVPSDTRVGQVTAGHYQTAEIRRGDIIIVPAQTIHRAHWNREHTYLALWLTPEKMRQSLGDEIAGQSLAVSPKFITPDTSLYGIGLALKRELDTPGLGGPLYTDSLVTALSAHLCQNYCDSSARQILPANGLPRYKLQPVLDYIHAHLSQTLLLGELAAIAQISPNYFVTQFKGATGLTPHQYVIYQRIESAKGLLVQKRMAIAEVAYMMGFSHQSHFTRHFKRQVGVTPKQFVAQS